MPFDGAIWAPDDQRPAAVGVSGSGRRNRVDPVGRIERSDARGSWTGNRGVLHRGGELVRPFASKAWLVCRLEFRGVRRVLFSEGRWTELFFLDEATAFAAGHRPCMFCRRGAAREFLARSGHDRMAQLDAVLHCERIQGRGRSALRRTVRRPGRDLPDGAVVVVDWQPFVVTDGGMARWTHHGYESIDALPGGDIEVLTPPTTLDVIASGYGVQVDSQRCLESGDD